MYEIEYFILCITIIVVLRFWDTNNLPMAIIMIIGLTFNIASVIYKSIVYKKNDIKNIIRKSPDIDCKYCIFSFNHIIS